ncbi:hypothetical protein [Rhodococcus kronopolitis]|uniref:Uncharacterized protein n=1 Tax=Rhodococcus kronopolitis TaxID=1460226 RepID=A0ABV9FSG2_9NOCA
MATSMKRHLAAVGAVGGLSVLGMIATPAVGSAAVTSAATVTANAGEGTISIAMTGLNTTKAFVKCEGTVYAGDATVLDKTTKVGESFLVEGAKMVAGQILVDASGTGTSKTFADGEYQVRTKCKEEGDTDYQDPIAAVKVTVTGGKDASAGGSADNPLGFVQGLLAGVLGSFGS